MVKIFLGGFPLEAMELELVQLVSPYCTVVTIKVVRDKKTKICKGYAFLEIETREGADAAIDALDGAEYKGRELKLSIVPDEPPKPAYKPPVRYARVERPSPSYGGDRNPPPAGEERKKRPRKF